MTDKSDNLELIIGGVPISQIRNDLDSMWDSGLKLCIIDFATGIGGRLSEAEVAAKEIKERNKIDRLTDPRELTRHSLYLLENRYADSDLIGIYSEDRPRIPERDHFDQYTKHDVDDSISYYAMLAPEGRTIAWPETRKRCIDINTGAFTSFGHCWIEELLKKQDVIGFDFLDDYMRKKIESGLNRLNRIKDDPSYREFNLFMDGNGTKACNDVIGYQPTTKLIYLGLAGMSRSTRGLELLTEGGASVERMHTAGDEAALPNMLCPDVDSARKVAERLTFESSMSQLSSYDQSIREFYSR